MTLPLGALLLVAAVAVGAPGDENAVLVDLVTQGVAMPDGSAVKLPAPAVTAEMNAAAQTAAITRVAAPNTYQAFTQKSSSAPVALKIRTLRGQGDDATFRAIDLWFVAHGDWDKLVSEKFTENFTKSGQGESTREGGGGALLKSGFLTEKEMNSRQLELKSAEGQEQRYFYTTFQLFDRVEVAATRHAVLTKKPNSIILATRVDPQFAKDAEYPNHWRSIERDAAAKLVLGSKQVYRGAGFYVHITKLLQPAGAIFVEYHSAFHEPKGWFEGENLLRAKLPTISQHQVKQFRGKLAKASAGE